MHKKLVEIMPAIRMAFSSEKLLSAQLITSSGNSKLDSFDTLLKAAYQVSKENVLELENTIGAEDLKKAIQSWKSGHASYPNFVVIKELGAFVLADSASKAEAVVSCSDSATDTPQYGRMSGRIVIVTGGAQGFGAGIAEHFLAEGANVVIADLLADKGQKMVEDFNSKRLSNKAYFVKTDVSDAASVENMVTETVLQFGGLDTMISNAGILRAGGLDEMTPETFELMTKVNYSGYFNVAKYASEVMKVQSQFNDAHYSDIIQINSKSGLKGSNRNFAYAGGKFGGIGLTQSFALELMPSRIKVNSICPGNFFDGPLWSDPENGLFVQYLNAGKVPGAKSIAEVKKFYEQQVPAGRGCEVKDVVRAIFYVIEQEYETGQAIPVTGGQNMLH